MKLSDFLFNIGRPVAFYPGLVKALQDRNEAIFICQMAYWRGKGDSESGWIYKTSDEIEEETSLTYKEQKNVRAGLVEKGLLEESYARTEHKMYYRILWDDVNEIWEQFTDGHMPQSKEAPSPKSSGSVPKVSSLNSNTENTQKNTQKRGDLLDAEIYYHLKPKAIRDAFRDCFKLTPNWETKTNRQFLEWAVEEKITPEQIKLASEVWGKDKRFNWQYQNLKGIQEHWLELIGGTHATTPNRQPNAAIDPEQFERDRATAARIKERRAAQQASV